MLFSSSASSTSGMPALTSSMSAPASIWATASAVTVESSPARSSSANFLRPVGLIRSPMMQNGRSGPIVDLAGASAEHGVAHAGTFSRRSSISSLAFLTAAEASAE